MRWDGLFDDLEGQAEALLQGERAAEVETRTRGEIGTLGLHDRLRAATGSPVRLRLTAGVGVHGMLERVGPDWLLLDEGAGREIVVATAHLLTARGLPRYSAVPGSAPVVESRLGLRHVLRGIARDRSAVRVHLALTAGSGGSDVTPGSVLDATIDRVGADFVEVATHSAGEPRRRADVRDVELVALAAVVAVRRTAGYT